MPMSDQPIRHRAFIATVAILTFATVPFAFAGRAVRMVAGIPLWLWWSMGWTVVLAAVVTWGIMRLWRDETLD